MSEFVTVPKDPWLGTTKPARTNPSDTHEGKRLQAHRAYATYPPKDEPCRRFEQTLRLALALEMFFNRERCSHLSHGSTVQLHVLNREGNAAHDCSECFAHQWEWKEARELKGQKQCKVKAIHTLDSLPLPFLCCAVPRSRMTTRRVAVNTNHP